MSKRVTFRAVDVERDAQDFRIFHTSVSVANAVGDEHYSRQQILSGITVEFPDSATTGIIVPTTSGCNDQIEFTLAVNTPAPTTPQPVMIYTPSPTPAPVTPQPVMAGVDPLPPPPPPPPILGCLDPLAANFDINAQQDDGSCIYTPAPQQPPTCRIYTLRAHENDTGFSYTACGGASQSINVGSGNHQDVCAEEGTVQSYNPAQSTIQEGATCTGPVPPSTPGYDCVNDTCVYVNDNATYTTLAECQASCTPAIVAEITSCPSTSRVLNGRSTSFEITFDIPADATYITNDGEISRGRREERYAAWGSEGIGNGTTWRGFQDDRGTGPGTHEFTVGNEVASFGLNPFIFRMRVTFADGTTKDLTCETNIVL